MRDPQAKRREFEATALPHLDEMYAVAMRYTRHDGDAQDLVQDTILRAYAAWDRFVPGSNCRAWLLRILVNGFINQYRKQRSHRRFADRSEEETTGAFYGEPTRARCNDPEGTLVADQLSDEVTSAVLLADVEGLGYRDIAQRVGVPVGTVMSRLFRARRQLESALAPFAATDYGIHKAA
jgi:RNA polymerase sigma-70 factor (ECF subfamily)